MKPDLIALNAIVDSVIIVDTLQYRLIVRVNSAVSGESAEPPRAGESLELWPQFVFSHDSTIDRESTRNLRLLSVRRARSGDPVTGTILLNPQRRWMLIDLHESQK